MRKDRSEKIEVAIPPKRIRRFLTKLVKGTFVIAIVGGVGYAIAQVRRNGSV